MTILIHIGFHKTATTWLQEAFFAKDPLFHVVADHPDVDRWIIRPHGLDFDADKARARFAPALAAAEDAARIPVISSEMLSGRPLFGGRESYEVAYRLKDIFGDARILITVRNQISILVSTYKQYISRCGTVPPDRFLRPAIETGYFGFDPRHYEYDRLTGLYGKLFGDANVLVMLYEDLVKDRAAFCQRVADFANGGEAPAIDVPAAGARGVSASDEVVPLLRRINHFRAGRFNPSPLLNLGPLSDMAYRATKKYGPSILRHAGGRSRESSLGRYLSRQFADSYRESNDRLSAMIGRDLSAAGYPSGAHSGSGEAPEQAAADAPFRSLAEAEGVSS